MCRYHQMRRIQLDCSILNCNPKWMVSASEDDLREFVKILDENENHPRHGFLIKALRNECNRRAAMDNEIRSSGEWI